MARVCVIGLGYIGLPTAVVLAGVGHSVVGVDTNPRVLETLSAGRTVLQEPGIAELVTEAVANGRLRGSATPVLADVYILAVPTPIRGLAHKQADLTAVRAATEVIAPWVRPGNLVVLESTSPPGTTEQIVRPILERVSALQAGRDFALAYCPERVLPGRILHELVHNDRIVGGVDFSSAEAARDLYAGFVRAEIHVTDATTAELVKLMENTHRDVNIALANEFALVSEHLGVNVWQALELANRHPRVKYLRPGPGVGGHCIAVDPWFVIGAAPQFTPLIAASRGVNDAMPLHVADLVAQSVGNLRGQVIVVLGLTYKANVDDIRESPSAEVVELLRHAGAEVRTHDAMVLAEVPVENLVQGADCLLLLVDHEAYTALDPAVLATRMRRQLAVDTRGFLPAHLWAESGFDVTRLGDGRKPSVRAYDRAWT